MEDSRSGAYGAGLAGGAFDPVAFIKKPQVIVRLVSLLLSIVVFGCISSGGWIYIEGGRVCAYNGDPNACHFGVGVGVIAFLALIVLLVVDALFDQMSSIQHRKYAVLVDLVFSGFWTFMWFVCFCYLTNQWAKTNIEQFIIGVDRGNVQAAIAFSFFSIVSWGVITFFAVQHYRLGTTQSFAPSFEGGQPPYPPPGGAPPGGFVPYSDSANYQSPPFQSSGGTGDLSDYKPPTY